MTTADRDQRQRTAALRARLLASGAIDLEGLRNLRRDAGIDATRSWADQQTEHLLAVTLAGEPLLGDHVYPTFQFTDQGQIRPELEHHIKALQAAGLGSWQTWAWLTEPAALLSGDVPAEVLVTNPARGAAAVHRLASRLRGPGV